MASDRPLRIALVWRGDPHAVPLQFPRLQPIHDALERVDVAPAPVAFSEAAVEEARIQLLACDGVLAWVDPLTEGVDRTRFDALLREVSEAGVWVSAHPEVILKMGVKEVLARTRSLGWGTDTHAYATAEAFRTAFPARLAAGRIRVLKQNRGNGNQGVFKVELEDPAQPVGPGSLVTVLEARSDRPEPGVRLGDFMARCEAFLAGEGRLVDQAYQSRVGEGLIRCYMTQNRVIGFSEQFPRNLAIGEPDLPSFGMAREKTMHDEAAPRFQGLRRSMEQDWTPGLQALLGIETRDLPVLWDADFLYGPKTAAGDDSFVLCEINVSCVVPYPLTAVDAIAGAAKALAAAHRSRRASRDGD
ncbi:Cj0069 family protein [Phenylobacterium montanum]|uniref:Cj0069 family protein n=1 Tax=Phenylobacterium montanum TaxID=2823693 RepID=A0A975FZC4_9CAUL|nr:Cj0069 family protein [Caulobacter sp. S6]QUD88220.1 Cj0069 family protein [Caulobacter sp. S6]